MNFIQCARNQQEQNLKVLQYNGCLYFESVRDVPVGEELLVWYDDLQYDIYMGIPVGFRGQSGSSRSPCELFMHYSLNSASLNLPQNQHAFTKLMEGHISDWIYT